MNEKQKQGPPLRTLDILELRLKRLRQQHEMLQGDITAINAIMASRNAQPKASPAPNGNQRV